jgi:hypothetical protein
MVNTYLFVLITIIIFVIVTILGNTLVLVATWRERSLHEPNKYFIVCLAVADLLVGMILEPLFVFQLIFGALAGNNDVCRFMVWLDTVALTASIYSLTFISFDRYLKMRKPLQYRCRMTTSKSLKIILIIWFISTAFATYAATPDSGSWGILLTAKAICGVPDFSKAKRFYTILAVSAFFLPTLVILIMYALIFVVVHKRQKMLRNGELGQTFNDRNQQRAFLQNLKTIRVLLVVAGVFILCWGPFFITHLLGFYSRESIKIVAILVGLVLPYFNSLCNPIIYACLDRTYREAFKNLFQRMCGLRSRRRQPPEAIELRAIRTR